MDKYIDVPFEVEGIADFYDRCATALGYNPDNVRYDCRKVEVSPDRFDTIKAHYVNKGVSIEGIAQAWIMYGPKTNEDLIGKTVKIQEGFIDEN